MSDNYMVTVCAACHTASCWHGEFMCDASKDADIESLPASKLDAMRLEHPDNYSREKIRSVSGSWPRKTAS